MAQSIVRSRFMIPRTPSRTPWKEIADAPSRASGPARGQSRA